MNIGFDAKRAFHNNTGLGYYSRTLIDLLADFYPAHQYFLFNPRPSKRYQFSSKRLWEINPTGLFSSLFPFAWRSSWVTSDLKKLGIDVYHGLSHEIPRGIHKTGVRSVVTIHDLIHERFPDQYKAIDRRIYTNKYRYACLHANRIIAISQQTRQDLISFYQVPPEKISVCYQSCSPLFGVKATAEERSRIRTRYDLPDEFFLSVGTINDRKNLLNVCKAMFLIRNDVKIPLVVIGRGLGKYYESVKDFILQNGIGKKLIFLSEDPRAHSDPDWLATEDLRIIYQQATALIYPSFFEGFGVPVMEALCSQLPVLTSNVSSLPEVGGDAAYYVNPALATEIAEGMVRLYRDRNLTDSMKIKGVVHAAGFTPEKHAASVMQVYEQVMSNDHGSF